MRKSDLNAISTAHNLPNAITQNEHGYTLLHAAALSCKSDNLWRIGALININGNVNALANNGWSPLHVALFRQDVNKNVVIQELIEKNANVDVRDTQGQTLLHKFAKLYNNFNEQINQLTELLIEGKADVNAQDNQGTTPLHCAASLGDSNKLKITRTLIQYNANVNALNKNGQSPLFSACSSRGCEIERFLLEGKYADIIHRNMISVNLDDKARIDIKDNNGNTILHNLFVGYNRCDQNSKLAYLIGQISKSDINLINSTNNDGKTALYYAAFGTTKECEGETIDLHNTALIIGAARDIQVSLKLSPEELRRFESAFIQSVQNYATKLKHPSGTEALYLPQEKTELTTILKFFSADSLTYIKCNQILNPPASILEIAEDPALAAVPSEGQLPETNDDLKVAGEEQIDPYLDVD